MIRVAAARIVAAAPLLVGVATLVFAVLHLAPGDPSALFAESEGAGADAAAAARARLGLDAPLPVQYARWLASLARGDLGVSSAQDRPVTAVLADALPATLLLASLALLLAFALGVLLGLAAAAREGTPLDHAASLGSLALQSTPPFWLALLLLLVFADGLRLLPASGAASWDHDRRPPIERAADTARHLVLPAAALALASAGGIARHTRAALVEAKRSDAVRAARAKGLGETRILATHALRGALGSIVTLFGLHLPALFGGALLVETIFARPGLGRVFVTAVLQRDMPVVLGATLFFALLVVIGSLVADLAGAAIDPRLRSG
jgi:peptide/nickel transport system permease protein